ncbi:N-acetylmuramoyl-L-alanine amidase [Paenibacillus sp. GCM10012303]|uniref:N-acetylmuramoyl-L-alanine amidase family protein n=1 Tax=Paenibacillus sp. GCM10012303 TaxID=3317340 RepID=UPI00360910B0
MKIVIDAGHGGKDPGAIGNGLREKDIVLTLGLRIGQLLAARGVKVIYTRQTDEYLELVERPEVAAREGADYFLSLHVNAGGGTGFETFVQTGATVAAVAYQNVIHQRIALLYKQEGFPDRGTKQANLAVLRGSERAGIPAILAEYGFIDHPKEAAMLTDPAWLERLARATAAGVAAAFGLPDAPEKEAKESVDTMNLEQWQWKMLGDALDGLYHKGLLGDYGWAEKAYKGELTQTELVWLNTVAFAREKGVEV